MDKKLLAFLYISAILIVCGTAFMSFYYNPDNFIYPGGPTLFGTTPFQPDKAFSKLGHMQQVAPVKNFIAGTCALFLVGYLFLFFCRRFKSDSNTESIALTTTLNKISVETGRTEYELFFIAAEGWSVSENQIDMDFKSYLVEHVLPYYVVDFIRKNEYHVDQSLKKEEVVASPTSLWDLAKAILIFPGCVLLLPLLGIIFGYNFFR